MKCKNLSILIIFLTLSSNFFYIGCTINLKNLKTDSQDPQRFYTKILNSQKENENLNIKEQEKNNLQNFSKKEIYNKESFKLDKFFRQNYHFDINKVNSDEKDKNQIEKVEKKVEKIEKVKKIEQPVLPVQTFNNNKSTQEKEKKIVAMRKSLAEEFSYPSKKVENTNEVLLDQITEQTEKILHDICSSSKGLSDSLDQILNEMKNIKNRILSTDHQTFSKQKLYVEYTKLVNNVNVSSSELMRLEDILDMLKNSNCENLEELISKFKSINSIPGKLIDMIQKSLKKENIKMGLAILN